jgi:hypothetical protein
MEPRDSRRGTRINCKTLALSRFVSLAEPGSIPCRSGARRQTARDDWSTTTPGPMVEDTVTRFM